jgi:hypothetical protein
MRQAGGHAHRGGGPDRGGRGEALDPVDTPIDVKGLKYKGPRR